MTRIVAELANDIAFARTKQALPATAVQLERTGRVPGSPALRVTVVFGGGQRIQSDLVLDPGIFSVATYTPLAAKLVAATGPDLVAEGSPVTSEPEATLLNDRSDVLMAMDTALSGSLQDHFLDPSLHEQAALLIAAFSFRDHSGTYFNLLPELSRITAHRVFASLLRHGEPEGSRETLNLALVDVLTGYQSEALATTRVLPQDETYRAWSRVIEMRATHDYRVFDRTNTPSLLERFEWFNCMAEFIGTDVALKRSPISEELNELPDWYQILSSAKPSVEVGHLDLEKGLRTEMAETAAISIHYRNRKPATAAEMVDLLNAPEANGVAGDGKGDARVQVLGLYLWAQLLQREVCHAVVSDFDFMNRMWGVHDDASRYRDGVDKVFGALDLYPLVRRRNATTEPYYRQAQDDAMKLIKATPEKVPAMASNYISWKVDFCAYYVPPPSPLVNEWRYDNPLPGTVYNIEPRIYNPSLTGRTSSATFARSLHEHSPYQTDVTYFYITRKYGHEMTAAERVEAYGKMAEYMPHLCTYIADAYRDQHDVGDEIVWLKKATALDPSFFGALGDAYRSDHRETEAAEAYENWMEWGGDDVVRANDAQWLMDYYEHHGQSDQATKLADWAADEVYSARGLFAKAHLLEERNDYAGALEYYKKEWDRYGRPYRLIGFLLRHLNEQSGSQNAELLDSLTKKEFPNGLDPFVPGTAKSPLRGVLVTASKGKAGLEKDDILIGLQGFAVPDRATMDKIAQFTDDETRDAGVWRGGKVVSLKLPANKNDWGAVLADYRAKQPGI